MQNEFIIADPHKCRESWIESYVSLKLFREFIQNRLSEERGYKAQVYQDVLNTILKYPELQGDIPVQDMVKYPGVMESVTTLLFPLFEDENTCYRAIGNALTPEIFYGTNGFYNLLSPTSEVYIGQSFITQQESSVLQKEMLYQVILEKLYHYTIDRGKEWIHGFINEQTGLYQYYRVHIDRRFTEIRPKTTLPPVEKIEIQNCLSCEDGFKQIEKKIPIHDFVASGFSIMTLTDVTAKHAIDQIDRAVTIPHAENGAGVFSHIVRLLQTVISSKEYNFGILPIFTINNRPGLLYENYFGSILVKACVAQGVTRRDYQHFINDLSRSSQSLHFYHCKTNGLFPELISDALEKAGILYYSFVPVYNNNVLVGLFEVSTNGPTVLSEHFLISNLNPVLPFISHMMQQVIDRADTHIKAIIKDKFTTLQPSVEWKFKEVAWHFLRDNYIENKKTPVENIAFGDVYPLYGSIDIRNSTIERNKALRKDLLVQLDELRLIFRSIEDHFIDAEKSFLIKCDYWLFHLSEFITIEQELLLNDFLQLEVTPYLTRYESEKKASLYEKVRDYRQAIDENAGAAFLERRKLESSIQVINSAVGQYFDLFKVELQSIYPCFFEKLRTDGIEYDIYIGQSLSPKTPFDISFLQKMRLMQLQSMAAISLLTWSLLPQLQHELYTTQLVFIHSRTIDISFRNDERRFDVEGAYNIRYHIIKKRIDKVRIRNSEERLTQVGKIALVYYNDKDAAEYQLYIRQLQDMNILSDDLEQLELEELQGVSGLKALRVGVQYNDV